MSPSDYRAREARADILDQLSARGDFRRISVNEHLLDSVLSCALPNFAVALHRRMAAMKGRGMESVFLLGIVLVAWFVMSAFGFAIGDFYGFVYDTFGLTPDMVRFAFAAVAMAALSLAWKNRNPLRIAFSAALAGAGFNLLAYGILGFVAGFFPIAIALGLSL